MKLTQRGATLLEAILATAIMGIIMAFAGSQALRYAERQAIKAQAYEMAKNIKTYRDFFVSSTLKTSQPVDGKSYVMNPFWDIDISDVSSFTESSRPHWGSFTRYFILKTLPRLKLITCTQDSGELNEFVIEKYIECGKYDVVSPLRHEGIYLFLKEGYSINLPLMKTRPFAMQVYYVLPDKTQWENMLQTAIEISELEFENGFRISPSDIFLAGINKSGSAHIPDYNNLYSIDNLLDGDIVGYNEFRTTAMNLNRIGLMIELEFNENVELLNRDGSVSMKEEAGLCWSDGYNENIPCINAFFDDETPENNAIVIDNDLKVDGSLLFRDQDGNYRTPVITKYHTFTSGDNTISYIDCPVDPNSPSTPLLQKMVLVLSSFSTGTENNTNFTDPSSIISSGTKGANGKHAFTSGLSLEWTADAANEQWVIEGAIGFDARYKSSNDDESVVRNPKSMSFISLQWCE